MMSLFFYNLQNTFKKINIFLRQVKNSDRIAEMRFKIACDQLKFEVLQFNHSFRYLTVTTQVNL
jgi:hypothetical protein